MENAQDVDIDELLQLKQQADAVILGPLLREREVQAIADYVGRQLPG